MGAKLDRVAEDHGFPIIRLGIVGVPLGKAFAVGVAGGHEVGPVGGHHLGQLSVLVRPGRGAGISRSISLSAILY